MKPQPQSLDLFDQPGVNMKVVADYVIKAFLEGMWDAHQDPDDIKGSVDNMRGFIFDKKEFYSTFKEISLQDLTDIIEGNISKNPEQYYQWFLKKFIHDKAQNYDSDMLARLL